MSFIERSDPERVELTEADRLRIEADRLENVAKKAADDFIRTGRKSYLSLRATAIRECMKMRARSLAAEVRS
jgi:hypothetical protein